MSLARCFAVFGFVVFMGTGSLASAPPPPAEFHAELSEDDRALLYANRRSIDSWATRSDLPSSHINHEHLPVVGDQGQSETCDYWAWAYYYRTWQEAREHGWIHPDPGTHPERVMDPLFFHRMRGDSPYMANVVAFLLTFGAPSHGQTNWDVVRGFPTDEAFADAQLHRPESIEYVDFSDASAILPFIRERLAGGDLLYNGIYVRSNFDNYNGDSGEGVDNGVYHAYADSGYRQQHALIIIGYDDNRPYMDNGVAKTGALLMVNSWGPYWGWTLPEVGTAGFIWVGYDFFLAEMADTLAVMEDRPSVPCRDYAVIDYVHEIAHELVLGVSSGDPDEAVEEGTHINVNSALGRMRVDGTIRVPIDRLTETGARQFRLGAIDLNLPLIYGPGIRLGTIRSFEIHLDGKLAWRSDETPVTTTDWDVLTPDDKAEHAITLELGYFQAGYVDPDESQYATWGTGDFELAIADLDGDGDPDILDRHPHAWEQYRVGVRRNDGKGVLDLLRTNLPQGEVSLGDVADFNNDGFPDVLLGLGTEYGLFHGGGPIEQFTDTGVRFPVENATLCARAIDWDHDGHVDVAVSSRLGFSPPFPPETPWRFWWNNGDGTFSESGWRLPFDAYNQRPHMDFADMDRDGREDLVISVYEPNYAIRVFSFAGRGQLPVEIAAITGFNWDTIEDLQTADYDGDGWIDVIVKDNTGGHRVYRNNEGSGFSTLPTGLGGLRNLAFGDVDNDGIPDVAAQGIIDGLHHTGLYRNHGDGSFSYLAGPDVAPAEYTRLEDLQRAAVGLADFDQDGDLDFVAIGRYWPSGAAFDEIHIGLHTFENQSIGTKGTEPLNTPPSAPQVTAQVYDDATGELRVSWAPSRDDASDADGLSYRWTVGTLPGWSNLAPGTFPVAPARGLRPQADGTSGLCSATFQLEGNQGVFVSVQAVDEGLASSAWSTPLEVLPPGASPRMDVNRDGTTDAADIVTLNGLMGQTGSDALARADFNADATVSTLDRFLLATAIRSGDMPGRSVVDIVTVTPEAGGSHVSDELVVTVPPGAVAKTVDMVIDASTEQARMDSVVPESFHSLEGLPAGLNGNLVIKVPAAGLDPAKAVLLFGRRSTPTSLWEETVTWCPYRPVRTEGGMLVFEIPPHETGGLGRAYSLEPVTGWFGLATNILQMESDHISVQFPDSVPVAAIEEMLDGMEWAWTQLTTVHGFKATGISGKVKVCVQDLNIDGFYCPVMNYIAVNSNDINKTISPDGRRKTTLTAVHELTHRFTLQYRRLVNVFGWEYNNVWPDEATATWMESVYNSHACPSVTFEHYMKPFQIGLYVAGAGDPQTYGYGMPSLLDYFVRSEGRADFPRKLWEQIEGGAMVRDAINAAAGVPQQQWWPDFMARMISNDLIGLEPAQLWYATEKKDFDTTKLTDEGRAAAGAVRLQNFNMNLIASTLFRTILDPAHQDTSMKVSHMLTHNLDFDCRLSVFAHQRKTAFSDFRMDFVKDGTRMNGGVKCDVPLTAEWLANNYWNITALASCVDGPWRPHMPFTNVTNLQVAITSHKKWESPDGIVVENRMTQLAGPSSQLEPRFGVTYSITGPGLAKVYHMDQGSLGKHMFAWLLGETPADYTVEFAATMLEGSKRTDLEGGAYMIQTAGPVSGYRYRTTTSLVDSSEVKETVFETGPKRLTIGQDVLMANIDCRAVYDITEVRYDATGTETGSVVHANQETLLSFIVLSAYPFDFNF